MTEPTPTPAPNPDPVPNPVPAPTPDPTPEAFKWPDNWRGQIANELAGDNKELIPKFQKQLEQHLTPVSVFKSNVELRKKMDSGELKKPLPDNPTPEDIAAYRKANGIPETPDKYDIKAEGRWADESNKESFNELLKFGHDNHMPAKAVKAVADYLEKGYQKALDTLAERDEKERQDTEKTLRDEWGQDYKINENIVANLLAGEEKGFGEDLFEARLADGSKLSNDPAFRKFLARIARENNPVGAIMPSGTTDAKSIEDEIKTLAALQGTDEKKFWSQEVQNRLIELRGARDKIKQKAA